MNSIRAIALAAWLLQLAACAAPSYYAQAVSGHMKLMNGREDISALLASDAVDPRLAEELKLALDVRSFAIETLQLPAGDRYLQYVETGRDAVTWNVVAAPEFSLQPRQWCFLVSGCVSYRGYFHRDDAEAYAGRLANKGYDVAVSPAIAYSTLGWFDDPLLDTMLNYSDRQLASFLIHELAHQKLYIKGDTAFNEAYASFVEDLGTQLWLQSSGRQSDLEDWQRDGTASSRFQELLLETTRELEQVYGAGLAEEAMRKGKARVFARLKTDYETVVRTEWDGRDYFATWFSREPNNAHLALVRSYRGGVCAFRALYDSAGGDIARFHQLAAEQAGLNAADRRKWLDRPCPAIASNRDL